MTAISAHIAAVVGKVARHNAWLDRRDLEQQAALTMLEVERAGRVASAPDPIAYMACAVRNSLLEMVLRSGCAVHVGRGGWGKYYAESEASRSVEIMETSAVATPSPEDVLDRARALAEIRRVLDEASPAAKAVIIEEQKPADVAKALGLTAKQVYWQTEKARDAVRARLEEMVRE